MCKKYPGPRCTNHAKKHLLAAQAHLKEVEARAPRSQEAMEARKAHADALAEWDSTPGGQAALKEALESKSRALQEILERHECRSLYALPEEVRRETYPINDQIMSLEYRISQGKELRKKRNALYKFHQRHDAGEKFPLDATWDRDHKLDSSWQTPNGDEIRVYNLESAWRNRDYAKCAWRIRDGEPVAMVRFYDSTNTMHDNVAVLCDIEVNPFYRGEGLGVSMVKEISGKYGQLHTSGSYSTSGHRSLSEHVPLYMGAQVQISPTTTHYEFVDWERGDLLRF